MAQRVLDDEVTMGLQRTKINANFEETYYTKYAGIKVVDEDVVCTDANTDYIVNNHTIDSLSDGFVLENTGSRIKHTGSKRGVFIVNACYRFNSGDVTSNVTVKLKKNGQLFSETLFDFTALDGVQSVSRNFLIDLDTDDYLEMFISSSTTTNTVTVLDHCFTIDFKEEIV